MSKFTKNRRKILVILFLSIGIFVPSVYALYNGSFSIGVKTTTGDFVCDVVVDSNESYVENNEAYFLIDVNNFKVDGDTVILTSTDIDYALTIENKSGSNGLFRYVDEDGNTNGTPTSSVTISSQYLGKDKKTNKYKVYVTTESNLRSNVDYVVKLDAKQKSMEG